MKPSYEFLRLAVLVIFFLIFGAADSKMSAAGAPRTFLSSGSSSHRGWSKRSLTCSSRFNHNETPSFGVLTSSSSSRSRKARRLSLRLSGEQMTNDIAAGGGTTVPAQNPASPGIPDDDSRSAFWLRNKCHDGFVVVKEKNRVLAQHEGLDKFSSEVKLVKESCVSGDPKTSSLMTRLYSPSQERYICFNRKGKVRAVKSRRADRMGRLCAFYERTVPDLVMASAGGHDGRDAVGAYINLQSAHHPDWYLGFGPNPRRPRSGNARANKKGRTRTSLGLVHTRQGHRAALPRRMPMFHSSRLNNRKKSNKRRRTTGTWGSWLHSRSSKDVRAAVEKRCDFSFATGRYLVRKTDPEDDWSGLFSALPELERDGQLQQQLQPDQRRGPSGQEAAAEATAGTVTTSAATTKTATSSKTTNTATKKPPSSSLSSSPATTTPPSPASPKPAQTATAATTTTPPTDSTSSSPTTATIKNTQQISTQSESSSTTHVPSSSVPISRPPKHSKHLNKPRNIKLLIEKMRKNPKLAMAVRKRAMLQKMRRLRRARQPSFFYMHDQQVKVSRKAS